MYRSILVACLAVIGALPHLVADAAAPPKPDKDPKPNKSSETYVIMKARLYEVEEAFHNKLAKAKWLSKADLEELENTPAPYDPLFARLEKEEPTLVGKEVNIDPDKEGVLLTATKPANFAPTPDQLRQGKKKAQTIDENFTLRAQVHISADRRFVRVKFSEKSVEIEAVERVKVVVDDNSPGDIAELVFTKEASASQTRYLPDGGTILVPLHHRPSAARKNDRWLVAKVTPRIYIEAEERERRGQDPK